VSEFSSHTRRWHARPQTCGALPVAPDVRGLARRAALPAAVVAIAATGCVLAAGPAQAFADALARALHADPRWVAGAYVFEVLSFGGYVALLWLVGGRVTPRLGLRASAEVTLGGAAATRLLPTAGIAGVALTLWALRRAGLGASGATRTLLTFLVLLYSVFLFAMASAGALLALGLTRAHGPLALSAVPAAAAALALAAGLCLSARRPAAARARVRGATEALGTAVRDARGLVRSGDPRLVGALAWWAFDAAVLWAMLHAFGTPPSLAVVALAYFVGQVGNTMPIPGAVSGGIVGVLLAFGVRADLALVSVLAYRAVAIWLPAAIGLAALAGLRRTVARWSREDESGARATAVAVGRQLDPLPATPLAREPVAETAARTPAFTLFSRGFHGRRTSRWGARPIP
jgi:uncharacterized membrane protein YbhN (UPF0104 family)